MQRLSLYRTLLVAFIIMLVFGQMRGQHIAPDQPAESGESIQLFSDRALYCVSELIFFSAVYKKAPYIQADQWSGILYLELIKWDGSKLTQDKFSIKNETAYGNIQIPENIKSGNYYLRAYTKWMRNYSAYSYSYLPVKIINPLLSEIDQGPMFSNDTVQRDYIKNARKDGDIAFSGIKQSYKRRELVEFDVSVEDKLLNGTYILSVARADKPEEPNISLHFTDNNSNITVKKIEHLPEIRRLSLSGKAIQKTSNQPLVNEKIILTSALDPFYFSNTLTDITGSFSFSFPEYEDSHQFCLTTEKEYPDDIEFNISSDFCNQAVTLPYTAFELCPKEEAYARQLCTNAQLNTKFAIANTSNKPQIAYPPFFGKCQRLIYVKDYIELNNFEEFLFELVPDVTIVHTRDKAYLRLEEMGSLIYYPPLILFDNIPTTNDEALLAMSNKHIERIEVINGGYIVGNYKYSGLICIYSNKQDLAGIELNKNIQFFNYQLLSEHGYSFPDYSSDSTPKIADLRNLLFWQPQLELSSEKASKISFYTSDASGQYIVTLSGISDEDDSIIYRQYPFLVK